MVIARTRLEILQTSKLLQCVRQRNFNHIVKLVENGVHQLLDYNDPGADSQGDTALTLAASINDVDMVKFLLGRRAWPDAPDFSGRTPLLRAAEAGHVECVECLTRAGADVNARDREGKGVLFYCAKATAKHVQCAQIALRQNADVNLRAVDGSSALRAACTESSTPGNNGELCVLLIEYGADPNNVEDDRLEAGSTRYRTALMAACAAGNNRVVSLLLERGARVNDRMSGSGNTAVHEAAAAGHITVLQTLAGYQAQLNVTDSTGNTPIHLAASNGHASCCKFLAQRGCNPKLKNADGCTAQTAAKQAGYPLVAKECRRSEASYGKPAGNVTPVWAITLYDFCYHRRQKLLDAFEQLDGDRVGRVPRQDFLDTLQEAGSPLPDDPDLSRLVTMHEKDHGAGVDYALFLAGKKYVTKKYRAESFETKKKKKKKKRRRKRGKGRGRKTRVPILICTRSEGPRTEEGGPPEDFVPREVYVTDQKRFDNKLKRPRHYLQDDSWWYLPPADTDYIRINHAVRHSDIDTLKAVLAARGQGSVDHRDRFYKTPLMIAAAEGNLQLVQFFVNNGADVNATDNFKWTPLHFACRSGCREIVELMLQRQAAINAVTLGGATPLMRAVETGRPDIVQLLIDMGADLTPVNGKGKTVLDLAIAYGDHRVYEIIRDKWNSLPAAKNTKNKKPNKTNINNMNKTNNSIRIPTSKPAALSART